MGAIAGCILVIFCALTAAVIGTATIAYGICGFVASVCIMAIVWILFLNQGKEIEHG